MNAGINASSMHYVSFQDTAVQIDDLDADSKQQFLVS